MCAIIGLTCACAALVALWITPVQAHDIYTHLKNQRGASCCDGTDCRPAPYRIKAGQVQMLVDGSWFYIDRENVEYRALEGDTGETNGGHWCGRHAQTPHSNWTYFQTYCAFVPPNLTAR